MHDIRPYLPEPFEDPSTLLYIGYRQDACSWLQELYDAGNEITILEIHRPNAEEATHDPRVNGYCWLGDVRQVDKIPSRWDYVWWWHGPEHISKDEFPGVLELLKGKTLKLLACAAPWGRYDQGWAYGNQHERHLWSVYEEDFQEVGLQTVTDGTVDQAGSEIVGWCKV